MPPSHSRRLLVACSCAAAAAIIGWGVVRDPTNLVDFTWFWRAGRALLDGQSPYAVINNSGPYPYNAGFYYTLPTAIVSVPFALVSFRVGFVLFVSFSTGVLAYALTHDGYWRLPLLASWPMFWSVTAGQWSILATAALFLPWCGIFAAGKPTLGFVAFVARPSWRLALWAAAILIGSLLVSPRWPLEFLAEIGGREPRNYHVPLLVPGGFLLALAALRWRDPEARLLLAMSIVPQTMLWYDQLPLVAAARTYRQALLLALWTWVPVVIAPLLPPHKDRSTASVTAVTSLDIVWIYYLPLLALTLWRGFSDRRKSHTHLVRENENGSVTS